MTLRFNDRVLETTVSTGTGNIHLSGASAGYQTFGTAIGSGNTTYYTVVDGNNWEVGIGTLANATTLVRTPITSSNANAAISLSGSSAQVFCDLPSAFLNNPVLIGNLDTKSFRIHNSNTVVYPPQWGVGVDFLPMTAPSLIGDAMPYDVTTGAGADWSGTIFTSNVAQDLNNSPAFSMGGSVKKLTLTGEDPGVGNGTWIVGSDAIFQADVIGNGAGSGLYGGVLGDRRVVLVNNSDPTNTAQLGIIRGIDVGIGEPSQLGIGTFDPSFNTTAPLVLDNPQVIVGHANFNEPNISINQLDLAFLKASFGGSHGGLNNLYGIRFAFDLSGTAPTGAVRTIHSPNTTAELFNAGPITTQSAITMQGQGTPGQDLTVTGGNVIVTMDGGGNGGTIFSQGSPVTRFVAVPTSSIGASTDMLGDIAANTSHTYICIQPYNGSTNIWRRTANDGTTW